jgi:hypothetical protein
MLYIISEDIGYEDGSTIELVNAYNDYDTALDYARMCVMQSTETDDIALFAVTPDKETFEIAIDL